MISLQDLLEEIDFKPEVIYLHDRAKTIKIDYSILGEEFSFNLNSFFELIPVEGKVYFINRVYKNTTDLCLDTNLLELLKQNYEEQFGQHDQKISNYLLMVQHALEDLKFGDTEGIAELTSVLETSAELQKG